MKRIFMSMVMMLSFVSFGAFFVPQPAAAAPCTGGSFLGLPPWYKYLDGEIRQDDLTGAQTCDVQVDGINDVWFIVAAVLEMLLRVAALVAVGFIVYAGVLYIISQSQPDKTAQALRTAINAVVGLVIAIVAAGLVSFIAGRFN